MTARHRSLTSGLFIATLFAVLAGHTLLAQTAPSSLSGKWLGTFDTVHADGSVDPDTAAFSLAQSGSNISGQAGNAPDHLSPISSGNIHGQNISFSVVANPQMTVNFTLAQDGDHLHGTASGIPLESGATIEITVVRADDTWHTPQPVAHAPDHLFDTVGALDRRLFDAYNTCDLKALGSLVTEDLEFYHDKTGLAVGRSVFIASIQNNICGKVHRTLTPGSLEVHRLSNYGAVEIGSHTFTHPGHTEEGVGEAKFVMLWHFHDGTWQLTRVISYDHAAAKP